MNYSVHERRIRVQAKGEIQRSKEKCGQRVRVHYCAPR